MWKFVVLSDFYNRNPVPVKQGLRLVCDHLATTGHEGKKYSLTGCFRWVKLQSHRLGEWPLNPILLKRRNYIQGKCTLVKIWQKPQMEAIFLLKWRLHFWFASHFFQVLLSFSELATICRKNCIFCINFFATDFPQWQPAAAYNQRQPIGECCTHFFS